SRSLSGSRAPSTSSSSAVQTPLRVLGPPGRVGRLLLQVLGPPSGLVRLTGQQLGPLAGPIGLGPQPVDAVLAPGLLPGGAVLGAGPARRAGRRGRGA